MSVIEKNKLSSISFLFTHFRHLRPIVTQGHNRATVNATGSKLDALVGIEPRTYQNLNPVP